MLNKIGVLYIFLVKLDCQFISVTNCTCGRNPWFPDAKRIKRESEEQEFSNLRNISGKISFGFNSEYREYPWQVSFIAVLDTITPFCGGTIISDRFIVSAAHCFKDRPLHKIKAVTGRTKLTTLEEMERMPMPIRTLKKALINPNYIEEFFYVDIALVEIDTPFTSYSYLEFPICLPIPSKDEITYEEKEATVIGWGNTEVKNERVFYLKEAEVKIEKIDVCKKNFGEFFNPFIMICSTPSKVRTCEGDSGGPLMQFVDYHYFLIGITSFSVEKEVECEPIDSPVFFTRITRVLGWIKKETKTSLYCQHPTNK